MFFISVEVNAIIAQNPPKNSNKNSIFNRTCMNIGCIERASEKKNLCARRPIYENIIQFVYMKTSRQNH